MTGCRPMSPGGPGPSLRFLVRRVVRSESRGNLQALWRPYPLWCGCYRTASADGDLKYSVKVVSIVADNAEVPCRRNHRCHSNCHSLIAAGRCPGVQGTLCGASRLARCLDLHGYPAAAAWLAARVDGLAGRGLLVRLAYSAGSHHTRR